MGASLSVKDRLGSGHARVISTFGADTLFSMIKTSIGIPTSASELKGLIVESYKAEFKVDEYKNRFDEKPDIIIPAHLDEEIRDCIICEFSKTNEKMTVCKEGMSYNYLTGKCEYNSFSGFASPDCYDVCGNRKEIPSKLPDGFGICDGVLYYDTSKCSNAEETISNIIEDTATQKRSFGV
jgi:hypothetical protein